MNLERVNELAVHAKYGIICALLIFFYISSFSQHSNFASFDIENDLNILQPQSIFSHNSGALFIANHRSIFKFDGRNIERIHNFDDGFNKVSSIKEINLEELAYLNNGKLKLWDQKDSLIKVPLRSVINDYISIDERVFMATDSGIAVLERDLNYISKPAELEDLESLKISSLVNINNLLYIATQQGIYIFNLRSASLRIFPQSSGIDFNGMGKDVMPVFFPITSIVIAIFHLYLFFLYIRPGPVDWEPVLRVMSITCFVPCHPTG